MKKIVRGSVCLLALLAGILFAYAEVKEDRKAGLDSRPEEMQKPEESLKQEDVPKHEPEEQPQAIFEIKEIDEDILERIRGKSYAKNCDVPIEDLRYVIVSHYGFDGEVKAGELIVNQSIAEDVVSIFRELYEEKYPIEKIVLIDEYDAQDNASMADNNTSCFNYRKISGSASLSKHSLGLAIDINPLYNPYVKDSGSERTVLPKEGEVYQDRSRDCDYYIKKDDICWRIFAKYGFAWGGEWNTLKDYQHFEKIQ